MVLPLLQQKPPELQLGRTSAAAIWMRDIKRRVVLIDLQLLILARPSDFCLRCHWFGKPDTPAFMSSLKEMPPLIVALVASKCQTTAQDVMHAGGRRSCKHACRPCKNKTTISSQRTTSLHLQVSTARSSVGSCLRLNLYVQLS